MIFAPTNITSPQLSHVFQASFPSENRETRPNRLFKPLFQSEARWETIAMKMEFYSPAHKTHFHKKGFALSLIFESERFWNSGKREA